MLADQPGSEQPPSRLPREPETAEERKLAEALAELRRSSKLIDGSAESRDELDARDLSVLEAESLGSWVAQLRSDAAERAKATEEAVLKVWVVEAQTAARSVKAPKPRPSKPQRGEGIASSKAKRPVGKKRKAGSSPAARKQAAPPPPLAPPITPALEPPPVIDHALTRARIALAWQWEKLLLRIRPTERARSAACAVVRATQLSMRLVRLVASAVGKLPRTASGLVRVPAAVFRTTVIFARSTCVGLLRLAAAALKLPLRFISELDLAGLVGLLLAIMGVVAAAALLIRG